MPTAQTPAISAGFGIVPLCLAPRLTVSARVDYSGRRTEYSELKQKPSMKSGSGASRITRILEAISAGDQEAAGELFPLVYDELRRLARAKMAAERPGQTLQPTALVHEVYIRLLGNTNPQVGKSGSFLCRCCRSHAPDPH